MDTVLHWYPGWIWIGIIWGVIPVALLYYAARRPLQISYSLCAEHDRALVIKKRVVLGMWALFIAAAVTAVATEFDSYFMLGALVMFVVTFVTHFTAGLSLRVKSHSDGVFAVTGFGREFLWQWSDRSNTRNNRQLDPGHLKGKP